MSDTQPQSLIKFLDAESALAVLQQRQLRWDAPQCFNDPFTLHAGSGVGFGPRELALAAGRAIATAVFSRQSPPGLPGHAVTNVIRRWRAQRRFNSEDEVLRALRTVLPALVERQMENVTRVLADWRTYAGRVRVLRLHERHTDIGHWQRLADAHRGIALRLQCEDGGSFAPARAVLYQPRRPQITTLQEQVETLIGQARHVPQDHFRDRLLSRSRADAEEREWRCFRLMEPTGQVEPEADTEYPPDAHDDLPFETGELRAVYLGARLQADIREQLLNLLAEQFPETRVFQAMPHEREYGLEFTAVGDQTDADAEDGNAEVPEPQAAAV